MIETLDRVFGYHTERAEALYDLAKEADGPIVEVGTARGFGAVCLAFGARDGGGWPVYCIDPFQRVRGWANEPYGPEDYEVLLKNLAAAAVGHLVVVIPTCVQTAAQAFGDPPALTVWDTGQRMGVCGPWLEKWLTVCPKGSVLAINETGAGDLGVDRFIAEHGLRLREVRAYMRIVGL